MFVLSEQARRILKDIAIVSVFMVAMSSAYYVFAMAERYRGLTQAYLAQAQQLMTIL